MRFGEPGQLAQSNTMQAVISPIPAASQASPGAWLAQPAPSEAGLADGARDPELMQHRGQGKRGATMNLLVYGGAGR